ncbi:gfo/Idh/MocA family oxidoreductase [Opitutaceae bacterium TAV4]|nr:gfo/Idh/MocA family oxidoreductase [Opitutaceae bacterium TAV4]RRK00434.1 gfo/Idh/MocA family oxidoreductase [Opitutaceae bacterium TAV3]
MAKAKSSKPVKLSGKDSFNVAVIGAGAIGLDHIRSFQQHPTARVVALAEVSPERGREAADQFGIPELVTDWKKLLSRPDIDVFSIALPNYLHAPVALAALKAGKHVMLDKPMATNAADAAKLVAEAKKQKLVLMVGQNHRFTPEVQTARQLIDKGVLGDIYHAKTAWCRRAGIPRIGSWFTQSQFAGGGGSYDIGVHALDRCLYLLGEFDAAAVSGQTYSKFGPRGLGSGTWGKSEINPDATFDVDDLSVALIKLKSGRTVLLETSWAAHQPDPNYNDTQLFGTEAGLKFPPLQLFRNGKHGYSTELVQHLPNFVDGNRMKHFIDVLLGKAEPHVKPAESLAIQKILDAIYLSAKTGKEIRIK